MDTTTTTAPEYHLSWEEVDCPECEAGPGQACTSLWYGNGYVVYDGHPARHEAASYHRLEVGATDDDHVYRYCVECGYEDVD